MDKRTPRPKRCWQHTKGARKPSWVKFNLREQGVTIGCWLIWHDDDPAHPHPILMSDEMFQEHYK